MFLAGTGAVLLATPLASEAQSAGKVYRIGYLLAGRPPAQDLLKGRTLRPGLPGAPHLIEALRQELEGLKQRRENIPLRFWQRL